MSLSERYGMIDKEYSGLSIGSIRTYSEASQSHALIRSGGVYDAGGA